MSAAVPGGTGSRPLVLVAHGTDDPAGAVTAAALARRVRARLCFAGVRRPSLAETLSGVEGPAVVVPAFLTAGWHVRVDLPAQLAATGRRDVVLAEPVAGHPGLLAAAAARLAAAGWRPGDGLVLAAAGSADPRAVAEVHRAAAALGASAGFIVTGSIAAGSIAAGPPRVADVVASQRADGRRRVAAASWLLAPGRFQASLACCGADIVADPLGAHPGVAAAVLDRYHAALPPLRAA